MLVSRMPDISGRTSGHFQILSAEHSIFSCVATLCLALCVCLCVCLYVCPQLKLRQYGLTMVIAIALTIAIAITHSHC